MTQNNIKIAITGSIGSGKSTVAQIIAEQGFTVLSCDAIYKQLLKQNIFTQKFIDQFGKSIVTNEGKIDTKALASIVFSDSAKLQKLNLITHPVIFKEAFKRMVGDGVFFCEVPILFEGGYEKLFDGVVVVLRNREDCIEYASKRDNTAKENIVKRIDKQFDYRNVNSAKNYIIENNGDIDVLRVKTLKILEKISYN